MKTIISTIILGLALTGCVTETTYSSHMYGNNQDTATTDKTTDGNKKIENAGGAAITDTSAPEQCTNCRRNVPIITPAK